MIDNGIVKTLESVLKDFDGKAVDFMAMSVALDLINRQQAAIERLENGIEELNCKLDMANDCIPEQRAEAIKEFAEKVKANRQKFLFSVTAFDKQVDNLVKETVGDTE